MEAAMTAKMEEGFKNKVQARQQTQKDIMTGLKNEANARQVVQNDLQAVKDQIRQFESGSGSGSTECGCWKRAKWYVRKITTRSGR